VGLGQRPRLRDGPEQTGNGLKPGVAVRTCNFLNGPTQLLSCYPSRLVRFAPFVQQMDMESNGKRTRKDSQLADTGTGPIVWAGLGIDGQHAYFQLLHQGTHRVPVEFNGAVY